MLATSQDQVQAKIFPVDCMVKCKHPGCWQKIDDIKDTLLRCNAKLQNTTNHDK